LRKGEGAVAMQVDGADSEVGATKINGHVETLAVSQSCSLVGPTNKMAHLLCAIGHGCHISWDLAHGGAILLETLV
jgi:hypothetical protein